MTRGRRFLPVREPQIVIADAPCRAGAVFLADLSTGKPLRNQGPFPQAAHPCRRFPDPKRLLPTSPRSPRSVAGAESVAAKPPLVPRLSRLGPASDTPSRTTFVR
jgi:hypothetical protein